MGEKHRRLDRFRLKHTRCCFCGGIAATETIDHIPPKIIFVGSQLPAGSDLEFPACELCNRNSRQYDQIAAMLMLTSPREASAVERSHFLKAVRGVQNNAAAAIEEINRGFAGWGFYAREFEGKTGLKTHAAQLGPINRRAIFVLSAKLGMAYYYRETGRILPSGGAVVVDMVTNAKLLNDEVPVDYKLAVPFTTLSKHDATEQFLYRHLLMDDAAGGMFQFALHLNFMLVAMVVEDRTRHPVISDECTFFPGFLRTLQPPRPTLSLSASFVIEK